MITRTFKAVSTLRRDRGARRLQPVAVWLLALLVSAQSCETTQGTSTTGAASSTAPATTRAGSSAIGICFDSSADVPRRVEACGRAIESGGVQALTVSNYLIDRAAVSRDAGDLDAADADLSTLIGRNDVSHFVTARGQVRLAMGRYEDAIVDFTNAETKRPRISPDNYVGRSLAHAALGQYANAIFDIDVARSS